MNEKVERVAVAISNARDGFTESGASLVTDYDRDLARAAIAAIEAAGMVIVPRDPTEAMIAATDNEPGIRGAWQAMLTAASQDGEEG